MSCLLCARKRKSRDAGGTSVSCQKSGSRGDTGRMLFTFRRVKPDAGNQHFGFDERGGETGPRQVRIRRRRESAAIATAPLLDSTSMPVVGGVRTIQSIGGPVQLALGLWDRYDALHA